MYVTLSLQKKQIFFFGLRAKSLAIFDLLCGVSSRRRVHPAALRPPPAHVRA
jgi:hypothetical protein